MEMSVYNQEGKTAGKINLPEGIFGLKWNGDLVHQVVVGMQANKRTPVAHTKDRSEVRGGGRKPWKQKGTGRARHGSIRSPIWRGGGVTFGPRKEKGYSKKINKKMKIKALYIALSQKLRDGEILFVDALTLSLPKTTKAKNILIALSSVKGFSTLVSKKNNSALIILDRKDSVIEKSFNNMGNVEVGEVRNLNAPDILSYKYIIITKPEDAVTFLSSKSSFVLKDKKTEKKKVKGKIELSVKIKQSKERKKVAKKMISKKASVKKSVKKVVKK